MRFGTIVSRGAVVYGNEINNCGKDRAAREQDNTIFL